VVFRFRLVGTEGRDLDEHEFVTEAFKPGDTITLAATLHLRVVAVEWAPEGAEVSGTLTVEPLTAGFDPGLPRRGSWRHAASSSSSASIRPASAAPVRTPLSVRA
jgi:hypothetical protein